MTKEYFKELATFNAWANSIACGWIEQINDAQWKQEVVSSFNSIQETVLHIISSENAWLQRFQGKEKVDRLQVSFTGTKDDHIALWKNTSAALKLFVFVFDESRLNEAVNFKKQNGDPYSMPYYQLFAHVANHGTYHRGQLVTLLRQVGFTNVRSTDIVSFYRK